MQNSTGCPERYLCKAEEAERKVTKNEYLYDTKFYNKMIEESSISNIVNRIAMKIKPDRIYLFGSYAAGQENEDSDIDLLVIKDTIEPKHKRSIEIQRILIGTKLPVDIVVYTNDEFDHEILNAYSFVNSAIRGAKLMYERT